MKLAFCQAERGVGGNLQSVAHLSYSSWVTGYRYVIYNMTECGTRRDRGCGGGGIVIHVYNVVNSILLHFTFVNIPLSNPIEGAKIIQHKIRNCILC